MATAPEPSNWNDRCDKAIRYLQIFVKESEWTVVHDALDILEMTPRPHDGEPIQELCLCEHAHIIPRPGTLYRYIVDDKCQTCQSLAQAYK